MDRIVNVARLSAGGVTPPVVELDLDEGQIVGWDTPGVGGQRRPRDAGRVLDAHGLIAVPGYLDLQVNGAEGVDLASDPDGWPQVARALTTQGVTAWLPTLVTSGPVERSNFLGAVAQAAATARRPSTPGSGARVLGAHLEGPAISPERSGAHDPDLVITATELADQLDAEPAVADLVRLITLAPESEGAGALLSSSRRWVGAIGHTDASADQTASAAEAGARYVTHAFNAMSPIHHRAPGPALAALLDERLTIGLIVDGTHLADEIVRLVWRVAGAERVNLVSDATAALGMSPGTLRLGGVVVDVGVDGVVRGPEGQLAGTNLGLDEAVRNLIAITGCSLHQAVQTVTSVPARLLGEADYGSLVPGSRADVNLIDHEGHVMATLIGGEIVAGRLDWSEDSRWT